MSGVSANIQAKAERLLSEGRVEPTDGPSRIFAVLGDTQSYWPVVVTASRRYCPCKRWRETGETCSHLEAGVRWVLAEGNADVGYGPDDPDRIASFRRALATRRADEQAMALGL